jgi:biotin carboxyl carrier protein
MQPFKIKVNGQSYSIAVEQVSSQRTQAVINGTVFKGDWLREDEFLSWKVQSGCKELLLRTRSLEDPRDVEIWVAGVPFLASVQSLTETAEVDQAAKPQGGEICALMPGRVTSILVKQNDYVDAGAPVLILEAMKMQNEIASPTGGHVKSIQVREGDTVKKGSVLLEIV